MFVAFVVFQQDSCVVAPNNWEMADILRCRRAWLLVVSCFFLTAGCRGHSDDPSTVARVRLIDAIPFDKIDVFVNGRDAVRSAQYRSTLGYADFKPGNYDVRIIGSADHQVLVEKRHAELQRGEAYTVVAAPRPDHSCDIAVLRDGSPFETPRNQVRLRFASVSPDYSDLELAMDNVVVADGVGFGAESPSQLLAPGDYSVDLWTGDGIAPLVGPQIVHLAPGNSYTAIAMGRKADGSLALEVYDDGK